MAKLRRITYAGPMSRASATEQVPLGQVDAMPAVQPFNVLQNRPFPPATQVQPVAIGGPARSQEMPSTATGGQLRRIIPEQAYSSAEELRPYSMGQAIPGASGGLQAAIGAMQPLTISDEEMASMLKRADPEIIVDRDRNTGATTIYSPRSQKAFVINKPGISINDISNLAATITAALPAGRAATLPARAGLEAAIQTGIEAGQKGLGGEFNIEEPLLAGGFSAGTDLVTLFNQARRAANVAQTARQEGVTQEAGQAAGTIARAASTTARTPAGRAATAQTFEQIVNPDPQVVRAAQELGLTEVLPMRVFSRNPQYVQVEQALANMPGSVMSEGERQAKLAVAGKADEFITAFQGTRDLAGLDQSIVQNVNSTIDDLKSQSDSIYKNLESVIPRRTRVQPREIAAYLINKARDLGGIDKLDSLEKQILRESRAKNGMTYARLDQLRQTVGERYGNALRGQMFGDSTTFSLKNLYNALGDAQGTAIDSIASAEARTQWNAGKALVQQRKALEESAENLLGREFSKPIIPQVRGAINSLISGNTRNFEQVIKGVPEQYRAQAIVSAMDAFLTKGARNETRLNPAGFASEWEKLSRSPTAKKALMSQMPEGAERFLDNLAIISRQFASATATVPKTGIVKAMGDFGSDNGFLAKVLPMIPVVGSRIDGVFSYAGPDVTQAAADLMANPDFRRVVVRGAQGQNVQQAEAAVMRSPAFQAWTETLPQNIKARVLSVGLTDYLFEENQ